MVSFIHRAGKESVWRPFRVAILVSRGHTIPALGNWWYLLYWLARMSVCPALPPHSHRRTCCQWCQCKMSGRLGRLPTHGDKSDPVRVARLETHLDIPAHKTHRHRNIQQSKWFGDPFLSWIEGEQNFTWNRFYVIMLDFPNTKSFSIYMLKLSSFFLGCIIKEIKLIIQQSSDC